MSRNNIVPHINIMSREVLLVVNSKNSEVNTYGNSVQMTFQPALKMGAQATLKLIGANI